MDKQIFHFLKAYIRSAENTHRGTLFQVVHNESIYKLSVERLVHRIFYSDDYKLYVSNKEIEIYQYRVILYIKGSNSLETSSVKYSCNEGTLLLLSPGTQPSITPKSKGECVVIVFAFDLLNDQGIPLTIPFYQLFSLYVGKELGDKGWIFQLNENQKGLLNTTLDRLFNSLHSRSYEDGSSEITYSLKESECLLQLMAMLINQLYLSSNQSASIHPSNLQKVLNRIENSYNTTLTVDALAMEACLSRTHFLHSFKKSYGITPIQYQMQLRINAAKNLLTTTSMNCKEIACEVGISNVYYFSRLFKSMTDLSPTDYRKKYSIW